MCHRSCSLAWGFYRLFSHNVVTMEASAIGWQPWLITFWYLLISEQMYLLMHEALPWFLQIQRYQNGINQGGHPIALVFMATTLWETRLYKVVHKIGHLRNFNRAGRLNLTFLSLGLSLWNLAHLFIMFLATKSCLSFFPFCLALSY